MRILIVEDDEILSDGLAVGLSLHGFLAEVVSNCSDARCALGAASFGAIVLDLMLPDGSGLQLLDELRRRGDPTPVLMLTARDTPVERIAGLDRGADDYIGKPFDLDEVAARLRALSRRAAGRATPTIVWKNIEIDPNRRTVDVDGHPVSLSRREFSVLSTLLQAPSAIISKGQFETQLYGWQEDVESNAVEVHIHNLRAKIGKSAIETVRGVGYRLRGD